MPVTNPWLSSPTPTTPCPREMLEERILTLLATQNLAVIATVVADGSPPATPVRYYSLNVEIMFTSGTPHPSPATSAETRVSADTVSGAGWDAAYRESRGSRVIRTDGASAFVEALCIDGHTGRLLDVRVGELGGPYDAVVAARTATCCAGRTARSARRRTETGTLSRRV